MFPRMVKFSRRKERLMKAIFMQHIDNLLTQTISSYTHHKTLYYMITYCIKNV